MNLEDLIVNTKIESKSETNLFLCKYWPVKR